MGTGCQIVGNHHRIYCLSDYFTEKVNRAIVALLGAAVMIISGILTQKQALAGVDFNTLALLIGMMIIVAITENPDCFSLWQFGALKS